MKDRERLINALQNINNCVHSPYDGKNVLDEFFITDEHLDKYQITIKDVNVIEAAINGNWLFNLREAIKESQILLQEIGDDQKTN